MSKMREIKRLTDLLVKCPYCGCAAEFVPDKEVYGGKSYGHYIYLCRPCDAYVACQPGTNLPLGTLADSDLRGWRNMAHRYFDPMWKGHNPPMSRAKAYRWLSRKMNLPGEKTHIAMFNKEQCRQVRVIVQEWRKKHGDPNT